MLHFDYEKPVKDWDRSFQELEEKLTLAQSNHEEKVERGDGACSQGTNYDAFGDSCRALVRSLKGIIILKSQVESRQVGRENKHYIEKYIINKKRRQECREKRWFK
jgi:hypothetical protein